MAERASYVTKLGERKLKVGFLWSEDTIVHVKIAAAKAHMTESAWVEVAVVSALNKPQQKKKDPFALP